MFMREKAIETKFQIAPQTVWPTASSSLNVASLLNDDVTNISKVIGFSNDADDGDLSEVDPSDFNTYLNYEPEKPIGKNNNKPEKNFYNNGDGDGDEDITNICENKNSIANISNLENLAVVTGVCNNEKNGNDLSILSSNCSTAPGSNDFQTIVNNGLTAAEVSNVAENIFSCNTPCFSADMELLNEYQDGSLFSIDFTFENNDVCNNFTMDSSTSLINNNNEISIQQFNNDDSSTNDIDNILRNEIIKLNLPENEKEVNIDCKDNTKCIDVIDNNCSDNVFIIEGSKSKTNNHLSQQHPNKIENNKCVTNLTVTSEELHTDNNNYDCIKGNPILETSTSDKDTRGNSNFKLNRNTEENLELGMEIIKENLLFDTYFFNNYCNLREKISKESVLNDNSLETLIKDDNLINASSALNILSCNSNVQNNISDKNEFQNRQKSKSYSRGPNKVLLHNKNVNELEKLLKGYKNAKYILLNKILLPVNKSMLNVNNNSKINVIKLKINVNKKENVECLSNECNNNNNNLITLNVNDKHSNNVNNIIKQNNVDKNPLKLAKDDSHECLPNCNYENYEDNSVSKFLDNENIVTNFEKPSIDSGKFDRDSKNISVHLNKISCENETIPEKYIYNEFHDSGKEYNRNKCDLQVIKDDNNNNNNNNSNSKNNNTIKNENAEKHDVSYVCLKCKIKIKDKLVYKMHLKSCTVINKTKKSCNLEKCKVCGKCFKFKQSLNRHTKIVHGSVKPFTCLICEKKFTRKCSLDLHELLHKGIKNEICKICGDKFTVKRNLKSHLLLVHNVKDNYELNETEIRPFVCDVCGKGFKQNKNLKEHKMTHGNKTISPRIPQISSCKRGQQKEKIDKKSFQMRSEIGDNKYECLICNKFYKRSTYLKHFSRKHRKKSQLDTSEFTCNDCDKTFYKRVEIISHINKMHVNKNDMKQYKCEKCDKSFKLKSSLNNHMVVHDEKNNRPFKCDQCFKTFQLRSVLYRHKIVHSDMKNFKCSECDKCYSYKHNLKKHIEKMKHAI